MLIPYDVESARFARNVGPDLMVEDNADTLEVNLCSAMGLWEALQYTKSESMGQHYLLAMPRHAAF